MSSIRTILELEEVMSDQMKVKVEFPTWGELSPSKQSLINFYMENASLFLTRYNYNDAYYMLGSIVSNYRVRDARNDESYSFNYLNLYIPYYSEEHNSYALKDNIPYFSFDVPTSLVNTSSSLLALSMSEDTHTSEDPNYYLSAQKEAIDTIPVNLIPTIGDVENTDASLQPTFIVNDETNEYGRPYLQIPIDKTGQQFDYSFQLRSSSFTVEELRYNTDTGEQETVAFHDVYYKIGIGILRGDSHYSTEEQEISDYISMLKERYIQLDDLDWSSGLGSLNFYIGTLYNDYVSALITRPFAVDTQFYSNKFYSFWDKIIINFTLGPSITFLYIQLCNQDGSKVNGPIGSNSGVGDGAIYNSFALHAKEDANTHVEWNAGSLILSITDESIDGGFIPKT